MPGSLSGCRPQAHVIPGISRAPPPPRLLSAWPAPPRGRPRGGGACGGAAARPAGRVAAAPPRADGRGLVAGAVDAERPGSRGGASDAPDGRGGGGGGGGGNGNGAHAAAPRNGSAAGVPAPKAGVHQPLSNGNGAGGHGGSGGGGGFGVSLQQLKQLLGDAVDARCALPPLPPALLAAAPPPPPGDAPAAAAAAAAALAGALRTSLRRGLPEGDAADAAARSAAFGANRLPDAATSSLWQLIAEAAGDATMVMLMAAGGLSLGLSAATHAEAADFIDGAAILASVAICVGFAAGTNYSKESKFRRLNSTKDDVPVRVIRGGREVSISAPGLLVGDVLLVEAGDILPADGLLLPGSGELKVDESQLTGESDDVIKDPVTAPVVFSGSKILEGFGSLLVLAVGPNSQAGLINAAVIAGKAGPLAPGSDSSAAAPGGALRQQTALSAKLEGLAHAIGRLGAAAAAATLVFNCAAATADLAAAGRLAAPWALDPSDLQRYLDFFTTSITLLVVAVPEGLPLAVTLALAFSVQRMLADHNLVRHLDACETMAGCTTICSDKTGTLTANDMRVTHLAVDRALFRVRRSAAAVPGGVSHDPLAGLPPLSDGGGGGGDDAAAGGGTGEAAAAAAFMAAVVGPSWRPPPGGGARPAAPAVPAGWAAPIAAAEAGGGDDSVAPPGPGDSVDSLPWLVPEAEMAPFASIEPARRPPTPRRPPPSSPAPPSAPAAASPPTASASGSSGGSGDALSTLGMDQATYVSLSLDGGDEPLLASLLAAANGGAAGGAQGTAVNGGAGGGVKGGSFHGLSPRVRDLLVYNIVLNSTASVRYDAGSRAMDRSGNRTECALLEFAYRLQGRREALAAALGCRPRVAGSLPFTSARKLMAVAVADPAGGYGGGFDGGGGGGGWGATAFVKGAGEILLDRCSHRLAADGSEAPLSAAEREALRAECGKGGLRVLALAHKRLQLPPPAAAAAAAAAANGGHHHRHHGGGAAAPGAPPPGGATALDEAEVASGLVLTGLVGIEDPLRPEVPGAIADCQRAGILVRMITGDNARTAAAIARACGVLPRGWAEGGAGEAAEAAAAAVAAAKARSGGGGGSAAAARGDADGGWRLWPWSGGGGGAGSGAAGGGAAADAPLDPRLAVLEGPALRRLVLSSEAPGGVDLDAFAALWPGVRVLARCSPGDKHLIVEAVKALRAQGRLDEVVAMTGDGTNDAPALAAADVGFAMAAGTCIARDASDILLLDNNFRSIVSAVKWGRNVYASVTKFLQFQLTANVVAVSVAAGGAVLLRSSPLSAVQMLWVNLIMDSLASLALATESPSDALLDEPPHRLEEPLVPPTVVKHILGQAALQLAILASVLGPLGAELAGGDGEVQRTLLFNTFVWLQLFNQINCRRVRDSQPNVLEGMTAQPQFGAILAAEAALQFAIVEFGGRAFSTAPLTPTQWAVCIGFGATSLLVRAGLRLIPVGGGSSSSGGGGGDALAARP
ncbi:MAG: hypothetical protein J3K34DRAFT_526699 [Monoraphidium minutum]|nr:MAG: hypothetical protein J3K34DRAFT_526699 [Monoraphidium minutum]